jgi:hypothetical protein
MPEIYNGWTIFLLSLVGGASSYASYSYYKEYAFMRKIKEDLDF